MEPVGTAEGLEADHTVLRRQRLDFCLSCPARAVAVVLRSNLACVPEGCEGSQSRPSWDSHSSPYLSDMARFGGHAGGSAATTHAHADIRTTMNVYGDAVTQDMAVAHGKVVDLALNGRGSGRETS